MHRNTKILFYLVLLLAIPAHTVLAQAGKTTASLDDFVTQKKLNYKLTDSETKELKDALTYQREIENKLAKKPQNDAAAAYLKTFLQQANLSLLSAFLQDDPNTPAADHNNKTALMYAAEADNISAVSELIKWQKVKKKWTWTYRYAPTETDFNSGIQYINQCENPTSTTRGYNALMYASSQGHTDIVNYLLNAGADAKIQCQFGQFTALHLAQNAGMTETASVLEKKLEADDERKSKPNILWPFVENNFIIYTWILAFIGLEINFLRKKNYNKARTLARYVGAATIVLFIILKIISHFSR